MGRTSQGMNKPGGETAKGRKSRNLQWHCNAAEGSKLAPSFYFIGNSFVIQKYQILGQKSRVVYSCEAMLKL